MRRRVLAWLVVVAVPSPLLAQSVRVAATQLSSTHPLVTNPQGVDVSVDIPLRFDASGRLALRLAADWMHGTSDALGTTCSGLVPPGGGCAPEAQRESVSGGGVSGSAVVDVWRTRRAGLRLLLGLRRERVRSELHGQQSGRSLNAEKTVAGPEVGLEVGVRPVASWPLELTVTPRIGNLAPTTREQVVDGYTPLEDSFTLRRLEVGLAWRGGRAPARTP